MKKIKLDNLYESSTPLENTNNLWVDRDEGANEIRAIHRFKNGEWNPYLVSVDYLKDFSNDFKINVLSPSVYYTGYQSIDHVSYRVVGVVLPDISDEIIVEPSILTGGSAVIFGSNYIISLSSTSTTFLPFNPSSNYLFYIVNNEEALTNYSFLTKSSDSLCGFIIPDINYVTEGSGSPELLKASLDEEDSNKNI